MFAIFDRLDAQFQTSKNPKTNYRLFFITAVGTGWKIKKGLDLRPSSSDCAKNFLKILSMTKPIGSTSFVTK